MRKSLRAPRSETMYPSAGPTRDVAVGEGSTCVRDRPELRALAQKNELGIARHAPRLDLQRNRACEDGIVFHHDRPGDFSAHDVLEEPNVAYSACSLIQAPLLEVGDEDARAIGLRSNLRASGSLPLVAIQRRNGHRGRAWWVRTAKPFAVAVGVDHENLKHDQRAHRGDEVPVAREMGAAISISTTGRVSRRRPRRRGRRCTRSIRPANSYSRATIGRQSASRAVRNSEVL